MSRKITIRTKPEKGAKAVPVEIDVPETLAEASAWFKKHAKGGDADMVKLALKAWVVEAQGPARSVRPFDVPSLAKHFAGFVYEEGKRGGSPKPKKVTLSKKAAKAKGLDLANLKAYSEFLKETGQADEVEIVD